MQLMGLIPLQHFNAAVMCLQLFDHAIFIVVSGKPILNMDEVGDLLLTYFSIFYMFRVFLASLPNI